MARWFIGWLLARIFAAGKAAKRELHIKPEEWPTYSPDLHPLDYSIWELIEQRMAKQKAPRKETVAQYKERLKRTALRLPAKLVRQVVAGDRGIRARAAAIVKERCHSIIVTSAVALHTARVDRRPYVVARAQPYEAPMRATCGAS